jgi:nicotinate-nucleotide pyrophosphorylase (carboxylating)
MAFSPAESAACRRLVSLALEEDLGSAGDVTSQAIIPPLLEARTLFVARSSGVVAGLPAAALVAEAISPALRFESLVQDGCRLTAGTSMATLSGPLRGILAAERSALNFLQYLSGIATLTRRYLDAVSGLSCKIMDTRKTVPGWRLLAKYAVRCGGGSNHRRGLYDGVLIKDNHLAAIAQETGPNLEQMIRNARQGAGGVFVEIEVENLTQLAAMLRFAPDVALLDNMPVSQMRQAVVLRNQQAPRVQLEASGGINLETVRTVAETGVDRISIGALTHSPPALDIALDFGSCFPEHQ